VNVWLTRVIPDPRNHAAAFDLAGAGSAVNLHRRLMSLFPDGNGSDARAKLGILFRAEDTPIGTHLLLQSTYQPDLGRLPDGYGTAVSRPLDPLLDALRPGLAVRYRCVASPVRKPGATTRAAYRLPPVLALSGAAADEWWARQSDACGLRVLDLTSQPLDTIRGQRGKSGPAAKQRISHNRTRFDGTALITDPELLRTKIVEGIGRAKAYGCGLLSIAPARTPG
jgi:CRISPR system Cascade subunit CasE